MDFKLPHHLVMVQKTVRRFVDEELIPLEAECAEVDPLPEDIEKRLNEKVKKLGLWAMYVPKELGGAGLGLLAFVVMKEQVSRAIVGDIRDSRGFGGNPWPIMLAVNEEQKERYLLPLIRGEKGFFFALTEPNTGSDPASMLTTATRRGDDWVLNGSKIWITNVVRADFGAVFAITDKEKRARGGMTCFLVERDTPGFEVVRYVDTMGAARPAELVFRDCVLSPSQVVGEVGQGFYLAQRNLSITRTQQIPLCVGTAQRAFEMTIEYAKQRVTFGQPLSRRQAVQWMLVDSAIEINAARLMMYHLAWRIDQGEDPRLEVPTAKTFANEMGTRVLDRCIQIHGAAGISKDLPLERMYRDIRSLRITEGGTEVQRWVLARNLLRAAAS